MKNIIKTVSILTICAVIPAAFAATSRVSVTNKSAARLPSIAGHVVATGGVVSGSSVSTSTTISNTSYYGSTECIDKYTECIMADDICGSDMAECTNTVLFHGQMAKCLSVLTQCDNNGINALFGTSSISALSDGGPDNYTYPRPGSVLGQLIDGAAIANRYNTEQCVKSYTRCLNRDNICGADFELCTTHTDFKKQAVLCDSTLARCQDEGKTQLFGDTIAAGKLEPKSDSRLDAMITDGLHLASANAVKTCQRVTDNCLIGACTKNPLRCVEGVSWSAIESAAVLAQGETETLAAVTNADGESGWTVEVTTPSQIQKYIKTQCLETIGSNQYCHITYREKTPTKKDLVDLELQEDVFTEAYAARKSFVNSKIKEALQKFDTRAKDACYETIKSCAMRSCGGGLGSLCYTDATSVNGAPDVSGTVHVNRGRAYTDIKNGCMAIVNSDANCVYAAKVVSGAEYEYTYYDDSNNTFTKLFPDINNGTDPIGAIGKINALLASSYNEAAIENLKTQCEKVAQSCVRSMCGKDYTNCYRNRTDITAGSYNTDNTDTGLDRSMNKMGGILDYNIVMGLCMDTVTSASVCDEHLKLETAGFRRNVNDTNIARDSWTSYGSVREAWLDANSTTATESKGDVVIGCTSNTTITGGTPCSDRGMEACGYVDEDGCIYDKQQTQSVMAYALENGAKSLFQKILRNEEMKVQATYNAKLTNEMNICTRNNRNDNGGTGIMGNSDHGSTFMWAKLKSNKVPKNYQMKGLTENQFDESNDLYGSFCRARVTVMSDDKAIQDSLGAEVTAYFAVGDTFVCGSWISQKTLEKISQIVADNKVCEQGLGKWVKDGNGGRKCDPDKKSVKENNTIWLSTVIPAIVGGGATAALTETGTLGGLLSKANLKNSNDADQKQMKKYCENQAQYAIDNATDATKAAAAALRAQTACESVVASNMKTSCEKGSYDLTKTEGVKAFAEAIKAACNVAPDSKVAEIKNGRWIAPLAGAATAAGAGLTIALRAQKQKKQEIRDEAAQEWLNDVGNHITCYVGTTEVGSYGDPVPLEID